MRIFTLILFFCVSQVHALEAVITVLEAPMFKDRDLSSPVIKYLRKGDIIKVHPSLANERKYDHYRNEKSPPSDTEVANTFYLEDEFIPTVDRQGKTAWVLSEHIYVYFNDSREFTQTIPKDDPTDYRLMEPLPEGYPLRPFTGLRGQMLLGFSQAYTESYPYRDEIKTKGYQAPIDFRAIATKQISYDKEDRFYFGAAFNVRTYENSYYFFDKRAAIEKSIKLGVGPFISYDAYKGLKDRLNLNLSIIAYPFNQLTISQKLSTMSDQRIYRAYSVSPGIGLQYHRKKIYEEFDFVIGTSIESELPTTFEAKTAGRNPDWWQNLGNDKFTTRATFSIIGQIGIQAAY